MKTVLHDLGDEIASSLEKTDEHSVVIHADDQYASCRGCFKCWVLGGTMPMVLGIVYPIRIGIVLIQMALSFSSAVPDKSGCSLASQIATWLFLNSGVLFCTVRLSSAVRRESARASVDRPIYTGHDTFFSVRSYRGHIYDFIFPLSRPLSLRTFETRQMA